MFFVMQLCCYAFLLLLITKADQGDLRFGRSFLPQGSDDGNRGQFKNLHHHLRNLPPSRPQSLQKKRISWYDASHTFGFETPSAMYSNLLIRYAPVPAQGTPWPMPQKYFPSEHLYFLPGNGLKFSILENCHPLTFYAHRVKQLMFNGSSGKYSSIFPALQNVNVSVTSQKCPYYPKLESQESYSLKVGSNGIFIVAQEIWGAMRGLETLSQLVWQSEDGVFLINKTYVKDFPRFPHRGILLDTARHYLNKETILQNLEAMAQNKMNVFHWHMTDDQSFPFDSHSFPNITKKGAYDPITHIYSHQVVKEIIEAARLRGIRVIPEFDTPGHTFSWGYGQDHLLTPCYNPSGEPDGFFGPINPVLKSTYRVLHKLFGEILYLFKDKYVHLGGDEVPFDCWLSNPQLQAFMARNNMSDVKELLALYTKRLLSIVTELGVHRPQGSGYIVWQEVVDNRVKVKADTIVQLWMGDAGDIYRMTQLGLRTLYSTCWYLDYISYGQDWDKYYRCEQINQNLADYPGLNESLLMGGDVCLWAEHADDQVILPRLWPRASAAAERLWSSKEVKDELAAAPRIEMHRCRMLRRGLSVGTASGPGFCWLPPAWRDHPAQSSHKHGTINSSYSSSITSFEQINQGWSEKQTQTSDDFPLSLFHVLSLGIILLILLAFFSPIRSRLPSLPGIKSRSSLRLIVFIFMALAMVYVLIYASTVYH